MNNEITNGILKVYFPKNVSSVNANEISDELFGYISSNPGLPVHIDMMDTQYISSAGLRVLLKLQKETCDSRIINVSSGVYEIFDMTGFTNILTIEKKIRSISIEGAKLIGEGYSSKVYRIADDAIVKVFIRDTSLDDIKRELNLAKKAFILGIPTAISYDVVNINGRYGVVFELISCGLLRDALLEYPDSFDEYMKRYAGLLLTLNTTDTGDTVLPDIKASYLSRIELLKDKIKEEDFKDIKEFVDAIPNAHTFIHGDCHIKNIMYSGSDLLLIDMDTLSYGNPLFEIAQLYAPYHIFPQLYDNNCMEFFGISDELTDNIMRSVFKYYFDDKGSPVKEDRLPDLIRLAHIHTLLFLAQYEPDDNAAFEKAYVLYRRL